MTLISIMLLYGLLASLIGSAIIFAMSRVNPRLMLHSYPKDVQAAVPPQTAAEKRQTLYWGIPFWLCLLGFPVAAALAAKGNYSEGSGKSGKNRVSRKSVIERREERDPCFRKVEG